MSGPGLFALNEALAFADFARGWSDAVPYLDAVLDLELNGTARGEADPGGAPGLQWLMSALEEGRLTSELERVHKTG